MTLAALADTATQIDQRRAVGVINAADYHRLMADVDQELRANKWTWEILDQEIWRRHRPQTATRCNQLELIPEASR